MTPDQIIYEIPEEILSFDSDDISFLESIKEKYKDNVIGTLPRMRNYEMTSGYKQFYLENGTAEELSHNIFAKIANIFPGTINSTSTAVANNAQLARVQGNLNIHVDYRSAILTIPLVDLVKPITFWSSRDDDKKVYHEHYYTKYKPVLVNTHVEHNVIDNDEDRLFLQIGGFKLENGEDFQSLKDIVNAT